MIKSLKRSNRFALRMVLVAGIFVSAWSSCTKSPNQLGADILPENSKLNVHYTDTATLFAHSQRVDSVRTDGLSYNIVGSIADPVFGKTTAGFYTQIQLSSNGQSFGINPVLDSLVLQLHYHGTYGDTLSTLVLHTYEMKDTISLTKAYYSNTLIPVDNKDYSNLEFIPRPHDSIPVFPDTIKDILRVRLSDVYPDLGEKLLHASETDLSDNEHFQNYFKGLYLVAQPVSQGGVLLYFDLLSTFSNLTLYYKNDEKDSLKYKFSFSITAARVNRFEHDYSFGSTAFQQQVLQGDTTLGNQQVYIQGFAGVKTVLTLPYIKNFAKLGTLGINEAILELPGNESTPFLESPKSVALVKNIDNGAYDLLPDQLEGAGYFGGTYIASKNEYQFRITRYIQSLLSDTTVANKGLSLFISGGSVNPQRFIFRGPHPQNDTLNPIRLKIVYTETN